LRVKLGSAGSVQVEHAHQKLPRADVGLVIGVLTQRGARRSQSSRAASQVLAGTVLPEVCRLLSAPCSDLLALRSSVAVP
jgi:hypothetical protein